MNSETVRPATVGQIKDICATVVGAMPGKLSYKEAEALITSKGKLVAGIQHVFKELRKAVEPGKPFFLEIGGSSKEELLALLQPTPVKIWARRMIEQPDFVVLPKKTKITLVIKTVADLGFISIKPTYSQVLEMGQHLGLRLCPPETGARLWLAQDDLGMPDGFYSMAMETFVDSGESDPHKNKSYLALGIHNHIAESEKTFHNWLQSGHGLNAALEGKWKFIFRCPE